MNSEECTTHCQSTNHGDKISSALTKRAVRDDELCSYLNYVCKYCGSSRDGVARTSLHMAASCGRTDVCKWLVCQKQARIDERDRESGYTALHRCMFYGKIDTAVALVRLGANMNLLDYNDLTPLEHAAEDNLILPSRDVTVFGLGHFILPTRHVYAWGSNSNYTLGPQQARNVPEVLDVFHRTHPHVEVVQVCLEKFHTVIVTRPGEVYSYGLGQGGRLGLNSEKSIVEPTEVKLSHGGSRAEVKYVSMARDHTMFLTDSTNETNLFVCGSNAHFVLGLQPAPRQLLAPRQVSSSNFGGQHIKGICCGRYHSVVWTKHLLYTWGLNAGQLGHAKTPEDYVVLPKCVASVCTEGGNSIVDAAASCGATAIATTAGNIYVLHEYQCRKIASRQLDVKSIKIIGGNLVTDSDKVESAKSELKVVVLTRTGNVLIWQESDPQLNRCIFLLNRLLEIKEVLLNSKGVFLLTTARELFHGKLKPRKRVVVQEKKDALNKNRPFHKFLDRSDCVMVQVDKVHKVYSAESISCDVEGENFAVLNLNTACYVKNIPTISPSTMTEDFRKFALTTDATEDVTFKVGDSLFPAHKYIIADASEILSKMVEEANGEPICLDFVHPDIFEQLLIYVYAGECDLSRAGACPRSLLKFCNVTRKDESSGAEVQVESASETCKNKGKTKNVVATDPLRLLQEAAKKLGVNALHKCLNDFYFVAGRIVPKNQVSPPKRKDVSFDIDRFRDYYDVSIQSKNGKSIEAHKCVLVARSEFFDNMFSTRWNEKSANSKITLPFPQNTLTHLLRYLYTDQLHLEDEDVENLTNLLVLADHIIVPRLVETCEFYLARLISMKNVLKILTLARCYNARQLKLSSMEYVCLNLATFIEGRQLEQLDEEVLKELTAFYAEWNEKLSYRVITPFSDAIDDDYVKKISAEHPVNMVFGEEIVRSVAVKPQRKRNRSHRISVSEKPENTERNRSHTIDVSEKPESTEALSTPPKFIEVPSSTKSAPARLLAINLAHEKIKGTVEEDQFVPLVLKFGDTNDFPDLKASTDVYSKSPNKSDRIERHRIPKLSQKQRKRLFSEQSMKDAEEVVPEAPKNPWKLMNTVSAEGSPDAKIDIITIITEEKKQKENLSKMRSKQLIFTQIEDKAIEDLRKFYNIENVFDEIIIAERVEIGVIATPVWVQK